MSELIDHKIIDMPALWAVGAQVHVMNEGDNPLPAEWRKQFESGLFEKLAALPGAYAKDDCMGIIHSWPGDMSCFEYLMCMRPRARPDTRRQSARRLRVRRFGSPRIQARPYRARA